MMNNLCIMQQIEMDQSETERIMICLQKLSLLCQKYGKIAQSSDVISTHEIEYELKDLNEQIANGLVNMYTRRKALTEGIMNEN